MLDSEARSNAKLTAPRSAHLAPGPGRDRRRAWVVITVLGAGGLATASLADARRGAADPPAA